MADSAHWDVDNIVETSRINNKRANITGVLIYSGLNFAQIIEGGSREVGALLLKLQLDTRHSGIKVLSDVFCSGREFSDWSMAYPGQTSFFRGHLQRLYAGVPKEREAERLALMMKLIGNRVNLTA